MRAAPRGGRALARRPPGRQDQAAHRAFFESVCGRFHELDFREGEARVCGDRAAVTLTARCQAHNGQAATVSGIDVFRFDADGRILALEGYWDPSPLFAAAGAA